MLDGWPEIKGLPLWGHRVVIPDDEKMRSRIIEELHITHPGIVKMKALARSYVWWPGLDKILECPVKSCPTCQEFQHSPPAAPIHPWEFPDKPWCSIHINYASIENQDVLIVVDAYSKWIEAVRVTNTTAVATVTAMRCLFATHGIPETVVSGNGTQFISEAFEQFLSNNNLEYIQTAPKHPASKGLAERAVQTVKMGVEKTNGGSLEIRIQKFLMTYKITPQSTTGKSPSELLLKRNIRSRLDNMRSNLSKCVRRKQAATKQNKDIKTKEREFREQESFLVKNFSAGPAWLRGQVTKLLCQSMYVVELVDGRLVRCHVDHMRRCTVETQTELEHIPHEQYHPAILPPETNLADKVSEKEIQDKT
jgi:transposase InsO family protein